MHMYIYSEFAVLFFFLLFLCNTKYDHPPPARLRVAQCAPLLQMHRALQLLRPLMSRAALR